jgi:AbrB family looped-hinge helix DNA binding protein
LQGKNENVNVRITSKGQVTIPLAIRERFGFMPETDVEFVERDGVVVLERAAAAKPDRADQLIRALTGAGEGTLTTDEIMRLAISSGSSGPQHG